MYEFAVGRAAWAAMGLPMEGALAGLPTAADAARRDVFSCALGADAGGVIRDLREKDQDDCIVLNDRGIVMGRTRRKVLEGADANKLVEELMEPGPTTVRPDESLAAVIERMQRRGVASLVVATNEGTLIGILSRDEGERVLGIDGSEIEKD